MSKQRLKASISKLYTRFQRAFIVLGGILLFPIAWAYQKTRSVLLYVYQLILYPYARRGKSND